MNGPKQDNKNQLRPHMSEGGEPLFAWRFLKSWFSGNAVV
jgi:hypothetical protein